VNVEFRDGFLKDLRGMKDKALLRRVRELIETVEQARGLDEIGSLKRLKGGGSYYRVRIGDYRVGLSVENDVVTFARFLNRKDIYRYFP
jgi:mRNA interferase RelE/StbE